MTTLKQAKVINYLCKILNDIKNSDVELRPLLLDTFNEFLISSLKDNVPDNNFAQLLTEFERLLKWGWDEKNGFGGMRGIGDAVKAASSSSQCQGAVVQYYNEVYAMCDIFDTECFSIEKKNTVAKPTTEGKLKLH